MDCNELKEHLSQLFTCVRSEDGLRVATMCLYPSFDQVHIHVVKVQEGFFVHDGGGAYRSAWDHGRNDDLIRKVINREASKLSLLVDNFTLGAKVKSVEWLPSAMMAVANASAFSAKSAVERVVAAMEEELSAKIFVALKRIVAEPQIQREFVVIGQSGKEHRFDFAVKKSNGRFLLLDAISPHHSSIAHKYVSFADMKAVTDDGSDRFAVYERPLSADDASLIVQVAQLVPLSAVTEGTRRALH
jgi:hypothetical protein